MLLRVHKILIGSAIALAALFAARALFFFSRDRAAIDLGMGLGALVVMAVLAGYLRRAAAKKNRAGGRASPS